MSAVLKSEPEVGGCPPRSRPSMESEAKREDTPSGARRLAIGMFAGLNRIIPKARRKVLVHSIPDLEDGAQSVLHEVIERGLQPVLLFASPGTRDRFVKIFGERRAHLVPKDSMRAAIHFLTAKYVFVTHGLFGHPSPPSTQCVVNLWHGEPAGKVVGRYEGQRRRQATMAPVLSRLGQAYRCTEFGLHPSRVPVLGAPRNDRLLRADRERVKRQIMPERQGKPTFLWMPTFRATIPSRHQRIDVANRFPMLPFSPADVKRLDEWLAVHEAVAVVKPHPLTADDLPSDLKAIRVLSPRDLERYGLTTYTILGAFDGLITDISSVWVDYLLLDRPIVFAFPDIDDYRASRGINLEPYESWVPGPIVCSVEALTEALSDLLAGRDGFGTAREEARHRMHQFFDDKSAERVVDHVMTVQGGVQPSIPLTRTLRGQPPLRQL